MKPFPIPVVPMLGPGSQPEEDEIVNFIATPGEMSVFRRPVLHREPATPEAMEKARSFLNRWVDLMDETPFDSPKPPNMSLLGEDPDTLVEINELLGQGEVSVLIEGGRKVRVQETAFAGVWRVQADREDGSLAQDEIEAGSMPQAVIRALAQRPDTTPKDVVEIPGLMNAPALLTELRDQAASHKPGKEAHVVNLTLLPVTPEDLEFIGTCLDRGPVSILSRGYGNCRITATALPHTWWVQYFNSMDQLILNTLEVGDVPEVALAAEEDYADSVERLREWISTLETL